MGPQPITECDILAYFIIDGIDDYDERDRYRSHIRALDQVYMDHAHKKMDEAFERAKSSKG